MGDVRRIELGYNNVYLVRGRVLVDAGPDYRGAQEALRAALPQSPELVIATHGHIDHAGLGNYWQCEGVPVAMGAADVHLAEVPQLSAGGELEAFVRFVAESGAPKDVQAEVVAGLEQRRTWAMATAAAGDYPAMGRAGRWPTGLRYEHFAPGRLVADGDVVEGLEVLICPGHTPGNLVLVAREEGWLFSGDQLLPGITPTPAIQPKPPGHEGDWRFRSLPAFVAALERLHTMQFTRCFPGHGDPFDNVAGVIAENLQQIEQRTERVRDTLHTLGRPTLYDVCESLYPRALRRRFWQIASTVQGHLDVLETHGRVRVEAGRYEAAG
jgi:glyoxylase-like metal-dependent hydrolase (beta-lactamase superfamily II)